LQPSPRRSAAASRAPTTDEIPPQRSMQARERKNHGSAAGSPPGSSPPTSTAQRTARQFFASPKSRSSSVSTPGSAGTSFFEEDPELCVGRPRQVFFCCATQGRLMAFGLILFFGAATLGFSYGAAAESESSSSESSSSLDSKVVSKQPVEYCPQQRAVAKRVGVRFVGTRPLDTLVPTCGAEARVDAGQCFGYSVGEKSVLRCLPSFVIAGAQKAATGWLRQWLGEHPELAQGGDREIHYFDKAPSLDRWPVEYLSQFPSPSLQAYTYEKTPDYLPNATAMRALFTLLPSAKLVFMLRNPTSRAYSAFQHHCRRGRFGKIVVKQTPPTRRRRLLLRGRQQRRRQQGRGLTTTTSRLRPQPTVDVRREDREVVFQLEAEPSVWARAAKLAAPCAPVDFDLFVRNRANETRLVDWGFYARQIDAIRKIGFTDDLLYVAFSEPAFKGRPEYLLDDVVSWLGLHRFDFATLPTYRDALDRQQIRHPGVAGFLHMLYLQYNPWMFYKHTIDPPLPSTVAFLDAIYRQPNRDLDLLLAKRAPAIAVFPPRRSDPNNGSAISLLPPSWSS